MLSKLLKHEFRATGRIGLPLCLGMIALSVLAAIALPLLDREALPSLVRIVSVVAITLYMAGFFALVVGVLVVIVERFYRSVLRDEGYLTMTLPASLGQILASKLICALLWYLIAALIACVSVLILTASQIQWNQLFQGIGDFFRALWEYLPQLYGKDVLWFITALLEAVVCAALVGLQVTLHFYAAMAIGHSFSKSKMLLSVLAFFVIGWAFSAVSFGALITGQAPFDAFSIEGTWSLHILLGIACGAELLADAVLYLVTHLCLKYRLNLE